MKMDWTKLAEKWKSVQGKYQYALLIMVLGVVLMLLPSGHGRDSPPEEKEKLAAEQFDLDRFEQRLERTLSEVEGAGETRVVLTLDSGSRRVLAQDMERDREGGGSSAVVTVGRGSGQEDVVPLQTLAPKFRGVLVVCPGGGNPQVKLRLTEALTALTGLRAGQIAICAGNT